MSLALPSTIAPAPPPRSSSSSTASAARANGQENDDRPDFGEVMARSMAPAAESAEPARAKPATGVTAKRQPAQQPADPQDLVNALALALVAPETKVLPAPPAGAATAGVATASTDVAASATGTATTPLAGLMAGTEALVAGSTLAQDLRSAGPAADASAELAPALAAASSKDAGKTAPVANPGTTSQDPALTLLPDSIAGPAVGTDTANSNPSPGRDPDKGQTTERPDKGMADGMGATPAAARSQPAKVAAAAPAGTPDAADPNLTTATSAVATVSGPPAPGADPLGAGAAVTLLPTTAAAAPGATGGAAPVAVVTASLAPEVGDGQWGKALGQQLVHMGKAGQQVAELQLNPPGLGPLKVTLSMNEHQIQAMFVSTHSSVRAAVEAALPQLRATLADNGLNLGNTSVSDHSQQQSAFAQRQDGQPQPGSYRNERLPDDSTSPAPRADARPVRSVQGVTVDTYA